MSPEVPQKSVDDVPACPLVVEKARASTRNRASLVGMSETPFSPNIQTQAELEYAWRRLMGPWAFDGHSVWIMFIVKDRPIPQLTEITEAHEVPSRESLGGLTEVLRRLSQDVTKGARVAFLRSRPGPDLVTVDDRAWAEGLYAAARAADVPCEVIHLGTRGAIRALPADELGVVADSA